MTIPSEAINRTRKPFTYTPPKVAPEIVYQDNDILVCDKPSGLLTVPGKRAEHADCLEVRIQDVEPDARIVHRLDKDTSGLIIFALNAKAHRNLGIQFERRHVTKTYTARVDGHLSCEAGLISAPLRCDWPNRPLQIIDPEQGREAETAWTVLEQEENSCLLKLRPRSGRSHQLRVHMLAIGHPILGDRFYGTDEIVSRAQRLQLHATTLQIIHPETGKQKSFQSTCPF